MNVTAYLFRFANKCWRTGYSPDDQVKGSVALTTSDCQRARRFWIRTIQTDLFSAEISYLTKGHSLPSGNACAALNPFLDAHDIIRARGRLQNAPLSFESKHPIVLANHPVVNLIVRHVHLKTCHSGVQLTLATLRQTYWVLRARSIVKRVIHSCVRCTRERASVAE